MTAKSVAIKGRGGKSGGCAVKAVGLTSGGLRRVRKTRTARARKGRHHIQLELALEPEAKGEARSAGDQGTEVRMARVDPERPAAGRGPSMEAVVEPGNLKKALARVRRNKGAPGIDGMTVEELGAYLKDHWPETKSRLLDGTYEPQPVRRVEIPKASGGVRPLGVPTVADQQQPRALLRAAQCLLRPAWPRIC